MFHWNQVSAVRRALLGLTLVFTACSAVAQSNWPTKPIKIIIPFPPGDSIDITARMIGPKLTELWGQPVIVENIAGGSGQVGMGALARATPDGHTIGVGQAGNLVVIPHTFRKVPYDPLKSFVPVSLTTTNFQAIVANNDAPFKNLTEMIAYAKANPGKLSVATNGDGGYPHLTFEDLRQKAGFTYLHVPYKGSVQVTNDVLSGQVQAGILGMAPFAPHIRAGKMKLIAISPPYKVSDWPDAQLTQDAVPGFSALGWFGYVAPAGTPPDIVEKLNKGINAAIAQPAVMERLQNLGLMAVNESPQYFEKILRADYERYGQIVKSIGYQPQ
ncbi:MAG: tripartite tricarboxylate transporter substrate binding protein [Alphaproteobacteria bacterium]|nr:tripartite tricarboxylate transporter substrate binding protein [Alphaproteobacteria bacterium]